MTTTKQFTLGSVSTGTMRTEDLLPKFADALRNLTWKDGQRPASEMFSTLFQEVTKYFDASDENPVAAPEELSADLQEALTECCPPFVYFGAHPGDGADFGFFPDWDALTEAMANAGFTSYKYGDMYLEDAILQVNEQGPGEGNVTLLTLDRQVIWTTKE